MAATKCYMVGCMNNNLRKKLTDIGFRVLDFLFLAAGPYECKIVAYMDNGQGMVSPCDLEVNLAPEYVDCGRDIEKFLATAKDIIQ